jgi:hypothetical protein
MNLKSKLKWPQYVGIGASILIPALVIAQQQRNPPADNTFAPQTLLRAGDVEQMRDALADALVRINQLEANAGAPVSKAAIYPVSADSGPIAQNAAGTAQVSCTGDADILVSCSCVGREGASNSLQFDLRSVDGNNRLDGESFCRCQGVNVGTNVARNLIATAFCLPAP